MVISRSMKALALAACLGLGACGGGGNENLAADNANHISEDPFGATGAPGADMTDNGATDAASGMADSNAGAANNAGASNNQ